MKRVKNRQSGVDVNIWRVRKGRVQNKKEEEIQETVRIEEIYRLTLKDRKDTTNYS